MVTHILFDNDGILVDTEQYYFQASQEILADQGLNLTQSLFREISLIQGKGVWSAFPDELTEETTINRLREKRDRRYRELLETKPITIDGVIETITTLAKNYRLAIVTSALEGDFLAIHARTGLLPFFDFYCANGSYKRSKPAPDPYEVALKRYGCSPNTSVVVEDSQRGITAGNAAGIPTVAIPTELTAGSDFSEATYQLKSITELPALLESL